MKISYNWLKQFIKIDLSPTFISKILTDLGLEVENVTLFESIKGSLHGVVVGEVIECIKHPNADRLNITKVLLDENNTIVQIICGAPNVALGQKVPVATVGTILYGNANEPFEILKRKIRGEISMGMICAEDELGIGKSHDGILVLDSSIKVGTQCKELFKIENDYIFEIGLTPNRADAMSHMGVARDLMAGLKQKNISYDSIKPNSDDFLVDNNSNIITVEVENKNKCFQYHGLTISNVSVKKSPVWLINRLNSIGISPKNNIIDATNYVLHDTGQPLHAFDANKINEKIIVKTCKDKTVFKTLDGVERSLDKEDLIICDIDKPLCLAGVFGGLDSGINENTKDIFLESAYFESTNIRKTAKRHNLNTDASFRFERGIDPELGVYALKRVSVLIKKIAGGEISSNIESFSKTPQDRNEITLNIENLNSTIGEIIPVKTIESILKSLEIIILNKNDFEIKMAIPLYRVDVTRPADVIEEILRIFGYNNLKSSNLAFNSKPTYNWSNSFKIENSFAKHLTSLGFYEGLNNSLTSRSNNESSFHKPVSIINPLSQELSTLRQSLIHSSLEMISFNLNRQNKDLKFFEFGKVYGLNGENYIEANRLCVSLNGSVFNENWDTKISPNTFYYLKGIVLDLLKTIGVSDIEESFLKNNWFSEGIEITKNKKLIVSFGLINDSVLEKLNIDSEVYLAEFDWDYINEIAYKSPLVYKEIFKYPSSRRDFALLLDESIDFDSIKKIAFKAESEILKSVDLFDFYKGNELEKGKKSYGISFIFQNDLKTLTDKQIDLVMNKLKIKFENELGAELR